MKTLNILFCILITSALAGCGRTEKVLFCEGTNPDGSGASCGSIFTPGELSAVCRLKNNREALNLEFVVYEIKDGNRQRLSSVPVEAKAGDKNASADLSLYETGAYDVEVLSGQSLLASGSVEIREE